MRKVFFSICLIALIVIVIFSFKNDKITIHIGVPLKEDFSDIKIIENSALKTLKYFSHIDSSALNSNFIVLSFWSPYCGPCNKQIPLLNSLKKKYETKNISFLSSITATRFNYNSTINHIKNKNFQFDTIPYSKGFKKSFSKLAFNKGLKKSLNYESIPNTIIISTQNDSIVYYLERGIQISDTSKIYSILNNSD